MRNFNLLPLLIGFPLLFFGQEFNRVQMEELFVQKFRQEGKSNWQKGRFLNHFYNYDKDGGQALKNVLSRATFSDELKKTENISFDEWYTHLKPKSGTIHQQLYIENPEPYSQLFINGKLITEFGNYFVPFTLNLDSFPIKSDTLNIIIRYADLSKTVRSQYANDKINYPNDNDTGRLSQFIRRPAYRFGWDIAPRFVAGSFKTRVFIKEWQDFFVSNKAWKLIKSDSAKAVFQTCFDVEADRDMEVRLKFPYQTEKTGSEILSLKRGTNHLQFDQVILNPRLWWPNGLYQQHHQNEPEVYDLDYQFIYEEKGRINLQVESIKAGFRTIKLIRKPDAFGESFYFEVNGIPVYIKGCNYVPDMSENNGDKIKSTLNFENINGNHILNELDGPAYNMIRIWGGGEYPSEQLLNYFDKKGVLLWQDFMFAGMMYPGDKKFQSSVSKEIKFQTKRISQHPCLALWCGNNEIEVAWNNWGWQQTYRINKEDSITLINNYNFIFKKLIPEEVKLNDAFTEYISTSPLRNWGKDEDFLSGDNHYWGVWHGELSFDTYNKKIPRFMSEYGFPSLPCKSTVNHYFGKSSLTENSMEVKNRMLSYKGIGLISKYMNDNFGTAKDFDSYIILSQSLQAEAYKTAIEANRRAKPFSMGTLYWQLNDAWPGISWSTIDFDGNKKAAWFSVYDAYKNVVMSATTKNGNTEIHVVSDLITDTNLVFQIKLTDFYGKVLFDSSFSKRIAANSSQIIFSKNTKTFLRDYAMNKVVLAMYIKNEDEPYRNIFYYVKTKDLDLPKPDYKIKQGRAAAYSKIYYSLITIKSNVLIKDARFFNKDNDPDSEDIRLFDILPGETIEHRWYDKNLKRFGFSNYLDLIQHK